MGSEQKLLFSRLVLGHLDVVDIFDIYAVLHCQLVLCVFKRFLNMAIVFRNGQEIDHIPGFVVNELVMFACFTHDKNGLKNSGYPRDDLQ